MRVNEFCDELNRILIWGGQLSYDDRNCARFILVVGVEDDAGFGLITHDYGIQVL
jgi:hypothetical protein